MNGVSFSPAKMCVVELPFKLYCTTVGMRLTTLYYTVNVCTKFTASIKKKIPASGKQNNIMGIPETASTYWYLLFKI